MKLGGLLRRPTLLVALVCVAVLGIRVWWTAGSEIELAVEAQQAGQWRAATTHYRRALRWYLPLCPHRDQAFDALANMAKESEAQGRADRAISAWRAARAGLNASSLPFFSGSEHLKLANDNIARLQSLADGMDVRAPHGLPGDMRTSSMALLMIVVGFGLWLFGLFKVIGIQASDAPTTIRHMGFSAMVGFAIFAAGILIA